MATGPAAVTEYHLAVMVLHYIDSQNWTRTSAVFKKEAKKALQGAATALPQGIKALPEVLKDYVQLQAKEVKREALLRTNPVVASLYGLLDFHAGLPGPRTLPPAFYSPGYIEAANGGGAGAVAVQDAELPRLVHFAPQLPLAQHYQQQQQQQYYQAQQLYQPAGAGGGPPVVPVDNMGGVGANGGQPAGAQHTPGRHALRKGAPRKRRKLNDDFDAAGGFSLSPGMPAVPAGDFLNQQMHKEGLAALLNDPGMQSRWAENLATHINEAYALGSQPSHDALLPELGHDDHLQNLLDELQSDPSAFDKLFAPLVPAGEGGPSPLGLAPQQQQQHSAGQRGRGAQGGPALGQTSGQQPLGGTCSISAPAAAAAQAAEGTTGTGTAPPPLQQQNKGAIGTTLDPIASYIDNPEEYEDLIDECVG